MSIMKNIFAAAGAAVVGAFVLGMVSDRILSEALSDDDARDEDEYPRKRCDRCCDCDDDYDEDDYDEEDEDVDEEDFESEDDLPEPDIIIVCRGFVHDDDEDKDDTDEKTEDSASKAEKPAVEDKEPVKTEASEDTPTHKKETEAPSDIKKEQDAE